MLKYLLSTVCIFLFLKDVQLNKYKCANHDCSKQIAKARVKITYSAKTSFEVNVNPGSEVYIHGFDDKNYLLKVHPANRFYLLPKSILKESSRLPNTLYDVEDPFRSIKSSSISVPTKHKESSTIVEVFYSMINSTNPAIKSLSSRDNETLIKNSLNKPEERIDDVIIEEEKDDFNVNKHEDPTLELDKNVSNSHQNSSHLTESNSSEHSSQAPKASNDMKNSSHLTESNSSEHSSQAPKASNDMKNSSHLTESNSSEHSSQAPKASNDMKNSSHLTESNSSEHSSQAPKASNDMKSEDESEIPNLNINQPKVSVGDTNVLSQPESKDNTTGPGSQSTEFAIELTSNRIVQRAEFENGTFGNNSLSDVKILANQNNSIRRNISKVIDPVNLNPETGSDITNQTESISPKTPAPTSSDAQSKNNIKKTPAVENNSTAEPPGPDLPFDPSLSQSGSISEIDHAQKVDNTSSNNLLSNASSIANRENTRVKGNHNETSEQENSKISEKHEETSSNLESNLSNPVRGDNYSRIINGGKSREGFSSDDKTSNLSKSPEKSKDQLNSDSSKVITASVPEGGLGVESEVSDSNGSPTPEKLESENNDQFSSSSQLGGVHKHTDNFIEDQLFDDSKDSSQNSENLATTEQSVFYMDVFGYISKFSSMFHNVHILISYLNFDWLRKQNASVEEQHCTEENCSEISIIDSMMNYGLNLQLWSLADLQQPQQTSFIAGILLLCTFLSILFSFLRNSKKTSQISSLISMVNQLEKKLLIATKEISSLEEQLTVAPVSSINQPAVEVNYETSELLKQQIEQLQLRNTDLEDKVTYLEKELHNVTTNAFEIHKLLENSLSTQAQSRLAEDEVDTLRALTERQERQIDELMKEMDAFVMENRYLKDDLKKMEKEFNSQTKKNLELSEKNRNLSLRFDEQIQEMAKMKSNYKSRINELQSKIEDLEISLRRSEFQVETLNRTLMDKLENKSDDQIQELRDNTQLKLQLSTLKAMNNELSAELKEHKNARRTLDDHIGDVIRKCNELEKALDVSEKERSEAVNKLQVLTDYFKEKESQLQKEITAKEKLFMESENKDQLLSQKLNSLKEEIKNNKDRNEELKKEIEAQESSFKTQLASAEQKSRDLYFALRQAERKYQESEKEAATLRNKILILENNLSSVNQKLNEKHSSNGDINGQPMMFSAEMLSYRSPTDFIPPPPSPNASHSSEFFPPEPLYSPDERLPPLGGRRVPSPPIVILPPPINVPPPEDDIFKPPMPHAHYMPGRSRHESYNMSSYYGDNSQYN